MRVNQIQDPTTTVYRMVEDALREQNREGITAVAMLNMDGTDCTFVVIANNHKGESIVRNGRISGSDVSLGGGHYYVDHRDASEQFACRMLAN